MMRKHFSIALVAISALLVSWHHDASARAAPPSGSDTAGWAGETGTASYYSDAFHGRRAASGVRFDQRLLTAAHPWLPFGTRVRVTLAGTGQSVVVTVTDRIYLPGRVVDLSVAAARQLGMMRGGLARVSLTPV